MSLMTLDPTGSGDPNKKVDVVEVHVKAMKLQILTYKTLIETHTEMFEQDRQLARQLADLDAKDQGYREDIKTLRDVLDGIAKQLRVTEWIKDVGGYEAKTIAPPGALGGKVAPRAIQVFPIAAIAGLLAGLCLAYLAEISDKSFRTPAEIRRRLGLPVIGHIPFYVPDEKAAKRLAAGEAVVDPMICTHYASNSLSSEAYRSVRTALYFNTQGVGHQVIQVTSPNVSDGKSTLAANLAVSIAQSGKRTILIDADCRRPRAHKIFGLTAETGLASVIAGQADLASAIQQTQVANLSLLPCGPRPANPSELLTSPRFKELLDIIRAQYDFVIVDTPPLLVVTDPCVVAPRVDGVIMAIRVTKNGRPFAERAKEILASLGANVLGVVVNGLGSQTGGRYGYGYDQYGYGYQYGYTYRYSYTYADEYSDDKAASYYRDEPATPAIPPAPAASADAPAAERSE
jgi:capsular exopolysaccharide synthesis family protein